MRISDAFAKHRPTSESNGIDATETNTRIMEPSFRETQDGYRMSIYYVNTHQASEEASTQASER